VAVTFNERVVSKATDLDIRGEATDDERTWLRSPEVAPQWLDELRRIKSSCEAQLSEIRGHGGKKRADLVRVVKTVEQRIAEAKRLVGPGPAELAGLLGLVERACVALERLADAQDVLSEISAASMEMAKRNEVAAARLNKALRMPWDHDNDKKDVL
jgi:hypothetical protein